MQEYIMALDEGTTSTRAIIFDHDGHKVVEVKKEFTQIFPKPGWVEHDPNEIWMTVQSTMAQAFIDSDIRPEQIRSIGITNQRETTIVWDKETGKPVYNAIVWQSRQTSKIADKLKADDYEKTILEKTGLIIDPYFSATKIRWILDHVPGAQERAEAGELQFGTIDTWLIWKLTDGKVHATDYTNASRTMLFNIHTLDWDDEILEKLNIPRIMLPEVKTNSEIFGYTKSYHFFGSKVPIAGVAGDQQASLIGQMCFEPGMVKNTYGTGSFIVMNTGTEPIKSKNRLLTTIAYYIDKKPVYALEGSVFVAGSVIQWLRDSLQLLKKSSDSERYARRSKSNNEVYIVPAFTGLGAPYWDSEARGSIFGLTRGSNRYDLIKASIQAIAYQSKDVVDTMELDSGIDIKGLEVDGGAASNDYLMQFQADILDMPVQRAKLLETTSLGVAFLAGVNTGFWDGFDDVKHIFKQEQLFTPQMSSEERTELYAGWSQAVKATRVFKRE